jgi:hypothetical protein
MPLVNVNPQNPAPLPQNPNIQAPEYRGVTTDLRQTPVRSLLVNIAGSPWEIEEYYSQYLNDDNAPAAQNVNRAGAYQGYMRIKRMEIMVTSGVSATQDQQSGEMSVQGSAVTYPGIIPNSGDMFVASAFDGRRLIYTVSNVERLSIMKDACYRFDFKVVSYDDAVRYGDLVSKIIKDTVFVRDFIYTNQQPFLIDADYEFYLKGAQFVLDSQERYLKDFVHRRFQTFLVPGQELSTYDPYIATAALKLIDGTQFPKKDQTKLLNVDTGYPYDIQTVWDGLLDLNGDNRSGWAIALGCIESTYFNHAPRYASIRWSGIEQVYHALANADYIGTLPTDFYLTEFGIGQPVLQSTLTPLRQPGLPQALVTSLQLDTSAEDPSVPVIPSPPPLIHHVSADIYYVFTQAFYERGVGQSVLEFEVNKALDGITLSRSHLMDLIKDSYKWTYLDRFYYLPVLWVLVRTSLAEM